MASRLEVTEMMVQAHHLGLTHKPKHAFIAIDYIMYKTYTHLHKWNKGKILTGASYAFTSF